jgi:hypothetical protein
MKSNQHGACFLNRSFPQFLLNIKRIHQKCRKKNFELPRRAANKTSDEQDQLIKAKEPVFLSEKAL